MAEEETRQDTEEKKSGGMMKTVMLGMGIFIIVIAAQTIAPLISSKLGLLPPPAVMPAAGDTPTDAEVATEQPPIYWPIKPALVVNFAGGDGGASFLQVELEVMARDQAIIDSVKNHTPAIRNALLLLLASQTGDSIFTMEGKQALRDTARAEINQVLEPYVEEPGVEAVYLTSFVAQ